MDKIYVVMHAYYSGWEIHGFFTNREDADKWVATHDEDEIVVEVECLDGKVDYSNVKIKYEHEVVFDRCKGSWQMRNEPDRYQVYIEDHLRSTSMWSFNHTHWIGIRVNTERYDRKLAEKIAQDILYTYLESCDGNSNDEVMNNMNILLRQEETERLEREEQERIRQAELAELARLKAKYEGVSL